MLAFLSLGGQNVEAYFPYRMLTLAFLVSALASLGYEKTCVLFNCGALASQIASEQNLDNDEGLKTAAKHYQV